MKTRPIPAIIMLTAGFITCIFGIINHLEIMEFVRSVLISMVVFFLIGAIVRFVVDRCMEKMADKEEIHDEEQIESEDETETTDSDVDE